MKRKLIILIKKLENQMSALPHNPKVVGSNPSSATKIPRKFNASGDFSFLELDEIRNLWNICGMRAKMVGAGLTET